MKIDCATLPGELLEAELFGFERGAFTGAVETKAGRFEAAQKGTIVLDEIAHLSTDAQAKLCACNRVSLSGWAVAGRSSSMLV